MGQSSSPRGGAISSKREEVLGQNAIKKGHNAFPQLLIKEEKERRDSKKRGHPNWP